MTKNSMMDFREYPEYQEALKRLQPHDDQLLACGRELEVASRAATKAHAYLADLHENMLAGKVSSDALASAISADAETRDAVLRSRDTYEQAAVARAKAGAEVAPIEAKARAAAVRNLKTAYAAAIGGMKSAIETAAEANREILRLHHLAYDQFPESVEVAGQTFAHAARLRPLGVVEQRSGMPEIFPAQRTWLKQADEFLATL